MTSWQGLSVDPADATPLHAQLERGIRVAIATGSLKPGDKLPTVRQLAVDLRVNANTVAKVYAYLERTGAVETRRGVGTFISGENGDRHEEARDAALRGLALKTLAEAARLGFSADAVLQQIEAVTKEHGRENRDEK
jgi:GntR family transcriptional regulator